MPSLNHDQVVQTLLQNRDSIRKYRVKSLQLFGSVARNEGGEKCDLDFLVDLEEAVKNIPSNVLKLHPEVES